MQIYFRTLLLIAILLSRKAYSGWDVEYWQRAQWNMINNDCFTVGTQGEIRLNHGCTRAFFIKLTEVFVYKPFKWLNLGFNYSYLWDKPRGSPHFMWRQRYELDISPRLTLENGITIAWRNRMMFIKEQDVAKIRYTFRHRVSIIYPLECWGNLKSIECQDEIFYHFLTHRFSQNRFVPLQLNYVFEEKYNLSVFFMIRNFESNAKWWRSFVIGSDLNF